MNSIAEHRTQTCRHGLLDRTLIRDPRHLLHALRAFESHCNRHRPHRALHQAAPLRSRTGHRTGADQTPGDPSTRSARRSPSRVPTHSLSRADGKSAPAELPVPAPKSPNRGGGHTSGPRSGRKVGKRRHHRDTC
ncbi:hypothetical protein [Streptomyces kebangsaanensis]|uniref:hypothetical protein n=1 Tax=Streptomyces kebangsaanensis TaxID=864058 RepID=UPI001F235DC1|nr:hypothetical protein [Streptomyces kebangsaanensis]